MKTPSTPRTGAIVGSCLPFPALPALSALSALAALAALAALELVGYLSLRSQYIVQCHDSDRRAVLVGYYY